MIEVPAVFIVTNRIRAGSWGAQTCLRQLRCTSTDVLTLEPQRNCTWIQGLGRNKRAYLISGTSRLFALLRQHTPLYASRFILITYTISVVLPVQYSCSFFCVYVGLYVSFRASQVEYNGLCRLVGT